MLIIIYLIYSLVRPEEISLLDVAPKSLTLLKYVLSLRSIGECRK